MNQTGSTTKTKQQKALQKKKVMEQLGELGSEAAVTAFNETKNITQEAINQLLGRQIQEKKSGDIKPGESLNLSQELAKKTEANKILEQRLFAEQNLVKEVQAESQKKLNQLRVRLQALMSEAAKVAQTAGKLSEQTRDSITKAPVNPGEYHIAFIQNLIDYIQTFRKKVDDAVAWMAESNKRSQKKNYWAKYKKHGASFLLSGEHYIARSAG